MKMLSDMGSIPIASTIVSTIWVAFTAWIVVYLLLSVFRSSQRILLPFLHKSVRGRRLLLMVRYPGNHEFPDHEKNGLDSDLLYKIFTAQRKTVPRKAVFMSFRES